MLVVAGLVLLGAPARAQEADTLDRFRFDLSQTFRATDNIRLSEESAGTTFSSETGLTFGYGIETGVQRLELEGETVLRLSDDPVLGRDSGFRDADLGLNYSLEGANSNLSVQSQYLRTDLAFSDPLRTIELDDSDLNGDRGERTNINNRLSFETGLNAPVGLQLRLSQRERRYDEQAELDPDLFDTTTKNFSLSVPLRLSATTRARVTYSNEQYDADDSAGTDRETERLTFGVDHALTPITDLSFDLGRSEVVEVFDALPGFEDRNSGTVARASVVRALPNGRVSLRFSTNITQEGRRRTLRLNRQLDLPDGELAVSIGVSDGQNTSLRPIGAISLTKERDSATFTAALTRTARVSTTSSLVTETTRLNLDYDQRLNRTTSLSVGLRYANIEEFGGDSGDEDRRRASVDVALNRRVTRDWNLRTGYQFRHSRRRSGLSGNSNALFFTFRRDFGALN